MMRLRAAAVCPWPAASRYLAGTVLDARDGNWQAPFIVAAGLLVIGAAVWAFWLDPDASVVEMQQARPAVAAPAV